MICPKCGARLAQGSTICPICGTKIRPSKVKVQDNYEEQPDQGYDSDSDDDYEENLNDDYDYDEEDDSYGNDDYDNDDYEPARPKTNRILVVIIVTVIALIAAMIVLIVLLFSSGKKSNKQIPYTVDKIQDTDTKKETQKETQKETETEVVEIKDNKVTSGRNVYELSNDELKLVEYNDQGQVVRIPAEIGGYSVTSIGSHAFKNNTSVQYLKLPDGMKKLDDSALSDIELLKEVVVPESVEEIGNLAFSKVQKAICVKGSFAWNYMKYMADEVVEGTSLSLDNNASTPSSSAQQTVPTQPTTAQQAASQPQPHLQSSSQRQIHHRIRHQPRLHLQSSSQRQIHHQMRHRPRLHLQIRRQPQIHHQMRHQRQHRHQMRHQRQHRHQMRHQHQIHHQMRRRKHQRSEMQKIFLQRFLQILVEVL